MKTNKSNGIAKDEEDAAAVPEASQLRHGLRRNFMAQTPNLRKRTTAMVVASPA